MALKVWLPLNGKFDNQGCTDNNVIVDGLVPFSNGKIGKAADFTSTNAANRVRVPGLELSVLSICAWFMSPSAVSTASYIINEGRDYNTYGWGINVNNNKLYFRCSGQTLGVDILSNVWYHVGITCENGILKYYLNGILQGTYSKNSPDYSESNGYINIGAFGYSVNNTFIYPFNGYINDIRIYDEVLSDKQIKEIAKGLCAHYKLEGIGANPNLLYPSSLMTNLSNYSTKNWSIGTINNVTSSSWTSEGYSVTTPGNQTGNPNNGRMIDVENANTLISAGTKVTFSIDIKGAATTARMRGYYQGTGTAFYSNFVPINEDTTATDAEWHRYYGTFIMPNVGTIDTKLHIALSQGYNEVTTRVYRNARLSLEDGTICWVPNEAENEYIELGYDKALTTDVSGFGYNGTITGDLTFDSDSPRYAGSTKFNGSSYITTTPGSLAWCNFDNLTISAWMKPTVKPGGWTGSIGIQQDGGTNGKVFSISNYAGNFSVHTDNGSGWVTIQSEALPLNQWSHCVATLTDGTNLKMYINGKLVKTATINYNTATVSSNTRIAIGIDLPGDDEKYIGSYSDARFYSTALSAEDILKLYEISGIIDNKGNTYSYEFIEED